ncbi:hypothetical protein C4K04_2496 [Pseudomonas chlororaphis]|uniref:Uncharacterized protein n=1 Tax=Pseudomonas chlororaphis TaxID=587753 RepID=A0A3G7TPI0_9PSED|nr:hypothetical protein C4K04_2496 [Pseudomonas chlororaphis]
MFVAGFKRCVYLVRNLFLQSYFRENQRLGLSLVGMKVV